MNRRGFLTGLLATPVAMALAPVAIELETLAPPALAPLFEGATGIYNGVILHEWGRHITRDEIIDAVCNTKGFAFTSQVICQSPEMFGDLRDANLDFDFSDDQDAKLDFSDDQDLDDEDDDDAT